MNRQENYMSHQWEYSMNIYIEKAECHNDAENNELIMSDEKCKSCDFYLTCRYVKASYDDVMYGDDEC